MLANLLCRLGLHVDFPTTRRRGRRVEIRWRCLNCGRRLIR